MFHLTVSLTSGRSSSFTLPQISQVNDLKKQAQESFGRPWLQLVTAEGCILTDPTQFLEAAGIQDGDHLTVIAQQPKLAATHSAFALWCCGGQGVVTWGDPNSGGDSSAIQGLLKTVEQIHATPYGGFAANLEDGSVVTWGNPAHGGDSSTVQDQLSSVQQIQATERAFAAILEDGSVVTWGNPRFGGDSSAVQDLLKMCSRFRPQVVHLQRSWKMAL